MKTLETKICKEEIRTRILKEKKHIKDIIYSDWLDEKAFPNSKGIYFLILNDDIIYVGSSWSSTINRIKDHRRNKHFEWYWILECNHISNRNLHDIEALYISMFTPELNKKLPVTMNNLSKGINHSGKNGAIKMKGIILNGLLRVDIPTIKYLEQKKEVKI
jgi:hypothetical protein